VVPLVDEDRMNITKLDAAKRQLATAIQLYFENCDPVSVHTLVMAAGEIIDRLCESKGSLTIREQFFAMIKPERRKEFGRRLNEARNFFKHASDPNTASVMSLGVEGMAPLSQTCRTARHAQPRDAGRG
jgi:hypothetical protein